MVGLFTINRDYLVIVDWPGLRDFGAATLVLFFAFGGAETALNSSGEISNPIKTIPRRLLLGVGSIFALYLALQLVAQGTLGPELGNNAEAPLAAAATIVFGSWGAQLLLLGMIVSIFGCLSGDLLNTPRVIFAAARDGLLPGVLAKVHPRHHTPHIAILFYAAIGCLVALTGTFRQLAVGARSASPSETRTVTLKTEAYGAHGAAHACPADPGGDGRAVYRYVSPSGSGTRRDSC